MKVGRYCLQRYVVGLGNFGKVYEPDGEICLAVTEGDQTYLGHFVVTADGRLQVRVDRQCLDNQLNEQSSLGNMSVTPCAKR